VASERSVLHNIQDLVRYRGLVGALVGRHLATRYRGSAMGFFWSLLNPLCLMLVYVLVFQYYIRFSEVPNYTIFLFCGLLPWLWTTSSLAEGTSALVSSGHLITKSMFPPHVLLFVAVITNMVNFLLALPLLFLFVAFAALPVPATVLMLPVLIVLHAVLLYGLVLILGPLNVLFRDVQHLVSNAISFLFFLCPIVYPQTVVPAKWQFTLVINPFSLLTMLYHQVLFDGVWPDLTLLGMLTAYALVALLLGTMVYERHREKFAELL